MTRESQKLLESIIRHAILFFGKVSSYELTKLKLWAKLSSMSIPNIPARLAVPAGK